LVSELSAQKSSASFSVRPASGRKKKKKKGQAEKGPAQPAPTEEYAGVPAYTEFKTSEKSLRSFLKKEKRTLKEFTTLAAGDQEYKLPAPVTDFLAKRESWFRSKVGLNAQPRSAPVSPSSPLKEAAFRFAEGEPPS